LAPQVALLATSGIVVVIVVVVEVVEALAMNSRSSLRTPASDVGSGISKEMSIRTSAV
jgi:hypothetical protein